MGKPSTTSSLQAPSFSVSIISYSAGGHSEGDRKPPPQSPSKLAAKFGKRPNPLTILSLEAGGASLTYK